MKIVQKNPVQKIMEIRTTGIGGSSAGGVASGMSLHIKGKIDTGQIKNWELQFKSFQEVIDSAFFKVVVA